MSNKKLRAWMITYQQVQLKDDMACSRMKNSINEEINDDSSYIDEKKLRLGNHKMVERALKKLNPTKYSFQLEKGRKEGLIHYQIFCVLEEPKSGREVRESMKSVLRKHWAAGCMTTSPLHSQHDSEIYCSKEDTRVLGPWFFPKSKYFGQDLVAKAKLYPWQRSLLAIALAKKVDPRSIIYIYDQDGNIGKSEIAKHLAYHYDACVVPLGLSSAQMKAAICNTHPRKNYLVDLPRNNKSYQEIYDTIEEIKRGFVISSFHGKLKNLFFERPNVFVFSNSLPDLRQMSFDMWQLYDIDPETREMRRLDKYRISASQHVRREMYRLDAVKKESYVKGEFTDDDIPF